jgi:serine/threonine protein kinase
VSIHGIARDTVVDERYRVLNRIGSGGMADVYCAEDLQLGRRVALKLMYRRFAEDEEFVERFRREASSAAGLQHPNVVAVYDRGEFDGTYYIAMEFLEGRSLKQVVRQDGALEPDRAIDIVIQILKAARFAHRRGIVHRDIKPHNVIVDDEGRAKVTDFGIARSLEVDGMTLTGTVMGTSNYIAPEQARGQTVDEQTDVYSLGCVLYELLAGEVPYDGDNFVSVAMRHVNDPVPSIRELRRDVPPRLDHAIQRAMAKEHLDRFESMAEFAAELEACRAELDGDEGATVVVPPRAAPQRRRQARGRTARPRRWRVLSAALIGVGLAALAGAAIGIYTFGGDDSKKKASTPAANPVRLRAITAFDPQGDPPGEEHNSAAPRATDGNPTTYWDTEHYRSFSKDGVGVVLDAGRSVSPRTIRVTTDTPGFTAEVESGNSESGPFDPVSPERSVTGTTAFRLSGGGRYFVIWITDLGGNESVHVNEVRASR